MTRDEILRRMADNYLWTDDVRLGPLTPLGKMEYVLNDLIHAGVLKVDGKDTLECKHDWVYRSFNKSKLINQIKVCDTCGKVKNDEKWKELKVDEQKDGRIWVGDNKGNVQTGILGKPNTFKKVSPEPREFWIVKRRNSNEMYTFPVWPGTVSENEEIIHVREVTENEPTFTRKVTTDTGVYEEQQMQLSPEEKIFELCLDLGSGNIEKKYRKETCGSCSSSGSTCSAFAGCECICHKSSVEITRLELHELLRGLAEYFSAKVGE